MQVQGNAHICGNGAGDFLPDDLGRALELGDIADQMSGLGGKGQNYC